MNEISNFEKALRAKVWERDPDASVSVFKTMTTAFTGEYVCLIESKGQQETYSFNPGSGEWILVYQA